MVVCVFVICCICIEWVFVMECVVIVWGGFGGVFGCCWVF